MKFVIETSHPGESAWWLVDDDRRVLAWAGRTFADPAHADEAAHEFRVGADDPDFRVHEQAGGSWWWTAWSPDGVRVAVSGESFLSRDAAHDAAGRVRARARVAIGP
jgi:hypothetical protein